MQAFTVKFLASEIGDMIVVYFVVSVKWFEST